MTIGEFELIERYFAGLTPAASGVIRGIGDDAAVIDVPDGCELVVSTDTLTAGVHFPAGTDAADIGYKALAVNLSDMAAMACWAAGLSI